MVVYHNVFCFLLIVWGHQPSSPLPLSTPRHRDLHQEHHYCQPCLFSTLDIETLLSVRVGQAVFKIFKTWHLMSALHLKDIQLFVWFDRNLLCQVRLMILMPLSDDQKVVIEVTVFTLLVFIFLPFIRTVRRVERQRKQWLLRASWWCPVVKRRLSW